MNIARSMLRLTALAALILSTPSLMQAQALELPGRSSSEARTSQNGWVGQTIGTHDVLMSFGRPYVKGRNVFGGLEKFGKVWRAGANEATAIVIPVDAKIEGEDLAAGVYSFFTIPGESEWTLIFSSKADVWGKPYSDENDVLRVTVVSVRRRDAYFGDHRPALGNHRGSVLDFIRGIVGSQ
jgi:hypothetical protein